jgi:hypothetical protein
MGERRRYERVKTLKDELKKKFGVESDLTQLKTRIAEIACKHSPDYPNIATVSAWEQLYAIEGSLDGITLAIEDWAKLVEHLGKKLHGDKWCPELLMEEWKVVKKGDPGF